MSLDRVAAIARELLESPEDRILSSRRGALLHAFEIFIGQGHRLQTLLPARPILDLTVADRVDQLAVRDGEEPAQRRAAGRVIAPHGHQRGGKGLCRQVRGQPTIPGAAQKEGQDRIHPPDVEATGRKNARHPVGPARGANPRTGVARAASRTVRAPFRPGGRLGKWGSRSGSNHALPPRLLSRHPANPAGRRVTDPWVRGPGARA